VEVAGKTGTAQESTSKPNHGLFVGFAPYQSPEIAFSIKIMNGYSSDYAAQVGKDISVYYFDLADKEEIITGTADEPLNVTTGGD
jgi:penicillin-binding protein 2